MNFLIFRWHRTQSMHSSIGEYRSGCTYHRKKLWTASLNLLSSETKFDWERSYHWHWIAVGNVLKKSFLQISLPITRMIIFTSSSVAWTVKSATFSLILDDKKTLENGSHSDKGEPTLSCSRATQSWAMFDQMLRRTILKLRKSCAKLCECWAWLCKIWASRSCMPVFLCLRLNVCLHIHWVPLCLKMCLTSDFRGRSTNLQSLKILLNNLDQLEILMTGMKAYCNHF